MNKMTEQEKKLWKALNRHGIYTQEDLDREYREMKRLNIGFMTQKPKVAAR